MSYDNMTMNEFITYFDDTIHRCKDKMMYVPWDVCLAAHEKMLEMETALHDVAYITEEYL